MINLRPATSRATRIGAFFCIIALAATLTLHRLGESDVCGFNEAVEGVFVQQMVEHGAYLFPLDNARAPLYKPPLFHWTATALDRVAGVTRVTAFNLRLPAALYAIAGVALTIAFAADFLGFNGAILVGLILCGSYQYIENGRLGRVDMTLCFCETLALLAFVWWIAPHDRRPRRDALRYLFALALGLAVLAKGPIGAILPAIAGGLLLMLERRCDALSRLLTPGPILLALLVGSSWYLACYLSGHHEFLHRQLGSENVGRFFGALGTMNPAYYLKPLLLNSAPLSLLVPVAIYFALRTFWITPRADATGGATAEADDAANRATTDLRIRTAVRLFAIFWLVTIVFFSLAAYKRRAYLLPIWPASAIVLSWRLTTWESWGHTIGRIIRLSVIAIAIASAGFNFFYLPRRAIRECGKDSYRDAAAQIDRIVGRDEPLYSYKLGDEPAALLFYLDRDAPPLDGRLGDAPPGYVITPAAVWRAEGATSLDLTPVFESTSGAQLLVLLRHGPALAMLLRGPQCCAHTQGASP